MPVTCDEVRELLPEYMLGGLADEQNLDVRRHLRGCGACRAELEALGDGLSAFAHAAHDRPPPHELRDRILESLRDEWRDAPAPVERKRRSHATWIAAAAAVLLVAGSITWGVAESQRAGRLAEDATSYRAILGALGGEDFRIGTLRPEGSQQVQGNVILYDAHTEQSWGLVIVHAPGVTGSAYATLFSPGGRTIKLVDMKFDAAGDASSWLVSSADLRSFGKLVVTGPDGSVLATAQIRSA